MSVFEIMRQCREVGQQCEELVRQVLNWDTEVCGEDKESIA